MGVRQAMFNSGTTTTSSVDYDSLNLKELKEQAERLRAFRAEVLETPENQCGSVLISILYKGDEK